MPSLVRLSLGLAIAGSVYLIVAGTYGITRWLTFRELGLAEQIETDTKMLSGISQAIVAGVASVGCYGISRYLTFRTRDENRG
jgi:hypothetical protein